MEMKLVDIKASVLRDKAKPVEKIDKKVKALIKDMKDTLAAQRDPEGVGLAAPQIGKSLQIFLVNHEGEKYVIINPKVLEIKKGKKAKIKKKGQILEGCLSLPHYYGPIDRAKYITISFQDESGKTRVKTFKGFLAQIIQHEIDHLNGNLFIDHIIEQKSPLYKFDGEDWEEVDLP